MLVCTLLAAELCNRALDKRIIEFILQKFRDFHKFAVAAILESLISLKINRHKMSQKSTSK
jgi:hypothetical protein